MGLTCFLLGHKWHSQRCRRCDAHHATDNTPRRLQTRVHHMKVWPHYFDAIILYGKRFEVRKNDRNYKVGDRMVMHVWDPIEQAYTQYGCTCTITYILHGGQLGIADDYAVLGFKLHAVTHDNLCQLEHKRKPSTITIP